MNLLQRLAIVLVLIIAAAIGGFFMGKRTENTNRMKADNTAFQQSHEVENEVEALNPYQRCLAVGGLPDQCKILLRGLDKTTESK
ncbi:hypothetical protein H3S83_11080 [Bartonella sp. W8122]|uniref:hypothetical protein n=1 Tax=Bartonella sp. W8122 TaxID=2750930 RepID=UPI0018DB8986|nr:hypothetical protein [Bartonella sp. W8122]MBI0002366.1 hypothetical protein [Bartonella sp. W8122]